MCLGIPGRVIELELPASDLPTGLVEFAGIRRRVCLACVPDVKPGDYVIVHAGIAISQVDDAEARRVFAYLDEIGDRDGWDAPTTESGTRSNEVP